MATAALAWFAIQAPLPGPRLPPTRPPDLLAAKASSTGAIVSSAASMAAPKALAGCVGAVSARGGWRGLGSGAWRANKTVMQGAIQLLAMIFNPKAVFPECLDESAGSGGAQCTRQNARRN